MQGRAQKIVAHHRELASENYLNFARTSCSNVCTYGSCRPTGHFMDRELFGKTSDEVEQGMRQAIIQTDQPHSSNWKLQTISSYFGNTASDCKLGLFQDAISLETDRLQGYIKISIVQCRKPTLCANVMHMTETEWSADDRSTCFDGYCD